MTRIVSHAGEPPQVLRTEEVAKILALLDRQLGVIEQLATTFVFIPEGSCLREVDL